MLVRTSSRGQSTAAEYSVTSMRLSTASGKRLTLAISLAAILCCSQVLAQVPASTAEFHTDTDHDGLSDVLEQELLLQFTPTFMIGRQDCSAVPAEFKANSLAPEVTAENGTIHGQAFPVKSASEESQPWNFITTICGGRTVDAMVTLWIRNTSQF